jgi:hypothetical protein
MAAARVQVTTYDLAGSNSPHGGTTFHFDQRITFRFTPRQSEDGDSVRVTVQPEAIIDIMPWHEMTLPRGVPDTTGWYARLVRHQFDYLAISADPRPVALVRHLVAHLPAITTHVARGTFVPNARAQALVTDAIAARYAAVVQLVQSQYDRLDSLTVHGMLPLPDRDAFYADLYGFECLHRANFPYLLEAAPLLADSAYIRLPRPCRPGER